MSFFIDITRASVRSIMSICASILYLSTHVFLNSSYLEENPPAEQLSEYAADGPHIHGGVVVSGAHQDLGRPVVLGDHLLRHVAATVRLLHARQAKVADLWTGTAVSETRYGLSEARVGEVLWSTVNI